MGKASGSCKGKGGPMDIADGSMRMANVDKGMLGARGIGTHAGCRARPGTAPLCAPS